MIRALFDANVIVSAFAAKGGTLARLLSLWYAGRFKLFVSDNILEEASRAWDKPYWRRRLHPDHTRSIITSIRLQATFVDLEHLVFNVASHPEDDLVLSAALSAGAHYLVTGDRGLLNVITYKEIHIVTPAAFVEVLERDQSG